MGFPKAYATTILSNVFKAGNHIALLTAVNTASDSYTEASGASYRRYAIKGAGSGRNADFTTNKGVTTSTETILFGLAEESWGTIVGIAIFTGLTGGTPLYLAELKKPKTVDENTVPVFKKYNESKEEGIKVTLDVESSVNASVNETN